MSNSVSDIENIIYKYIPTAKGYQQDVLSAMDYAFLAGGKRIRPMMMKLCFDMLSESLDTYDESVIGPFMAAIEMIHTSSLIHDDLPALDNDELRRGKPTVHVKYGEDVAIFAGDGLLNYAYETAAKAFSIKPGDAGIEKAFAILASKAGVYGMLGGQSLDVVMTGKELSDDKLEFIYLNKTSALIESSMMVGAALAGADDTLVSKLEEAARAVGMAFQVQDDILDIKGDEAVIGKPVHSDEKNDKYTYATIHGIEESKKYVKEMSDKANAIIRGIAVKNDSAREELCSLINALIDRDR